LLVPVDNAMGILDENPSGSTPKKDPRRCWRVRHCVAQNVAAALPQRAAGRVVKSTRLGVPNNQSHAVKGMDMTFKPAFLVAVLLVWVGIVEADGIKLPPTKEGLWETHSTQTQQGKTVFDKSVKMCQSNETTKSMQSNREELRKKNECTSNVTQPSTNMYVEQSRCAKGPNAGSVTKVVYTYQGDAASHTEMHMNVGKSETVMIIDAKYLGSCPAGMKPGDLIMDGKIISGGN